MADILQFPPAKRPSSPAAAGPARPTAPAEGAYFCTQCDGDLFRLAARGTIHCNRCNARMQNIVVAGALAGD